MLDPDKLHTLLSNAENYVNSSHSILSKVDVARVNSLLSELTKTDRDKERHINNQKL